MARFLPRLALFLLTGASLASSCASQKNPRNTLTMIYGQEYPEDSLGLRDEIRDERIFFENIDGKKMSGTILGNRVDPLTYEVIGKTTRHLRVRKAATHNIGIIFHGGPVADTTEHHIYARDNQLENSIYNSPHKDLMASKIYTTIGESMTSTFKRYESVEMIAYNCDALSNASGIGNLPRNSLIWMGDGGTYDYHDNMLQSFRKEKPWNSLGAEHFIDAHLLLQNAIAGYSDISRWNRGGYVGIVTDQRERKNYMLIDGERLPLGKHEVRIIDLERDVLRITTDFTPEEIEEAAKPARALVPAMLQSFYDKKMTPRARRSHVPSDSVLCANKFDENLVDITLAKLPAVTDTASFKAHLTGPEQQVAYDIIFQLLSKKENWHKAQKLQDFIRERQITERDAPCEEHMIRKPRYAGSSVRISE